MEVRATPHKKLQSAMEYLMTYGWAILVIAVVLGALFSLGVFSGASLLGTSCVAASGFYCSGVTLTGGGVLTLTIGQAYGYTFNNTQVLFVPSGAPLSEASSVSIGNLNSGQTQTVSIQLPSISPYPSSYSLGTPLTGYVYLTFTNPYKTTSTEEIATVTTKVVSSSTAVLYSKPSTLPSGITSYVPIKITNQQSTATPAPFQQMVQFQESTYSNYITYNNNFANFEFFTQSGTIIPAWIESNSSGTITVWLKLANGIGPGSANAITVYLGFASPSTNLLSSSGTTGIGEAPQLSSTYAQYDDGASVFDYYNVNPTSTTGWTIVGTAGQTASAPSGSHFATTNGLYANSSSGDYLYTSVSGLTSNEIISFNVYTTGLGDLFFLVNSTGNGQMARLDGRGGGNFAGIAATTSWTSWNAPGGITESENTWYKYDIVIAGSTAYSYIGSISNNLATLGTEANSYTITNKGNYIGLVGDGLGSSYITYWSGIIIRAYPPNGVMPSVSFGSVS